jgi:hypothetical protein
LDVQVEEPKGFHQGLKATSSGAASMMPRRAVAMHDEVANKW